MLDAPFFPNYKAHRKQTLGSLINQSSRYQALRNVKCLGLCSYVAINSKILKSSFVSVTIIECINSSIYCSFLLLKQFCLKRLILSDTTLFRDLLVVLKHNLILSTNQLLVHIEFILPISDRGPWCTKPLFPDVTLAYMTSLMLRFYTSSWGPSRRKHKRLLVSMQCQYVVY